MTIENKFNIGDTIWYMDMNRPISDKIVQINIEVYYSKHIVKTSCLYTISNGRTRTEIQLFATKEELIQSL